MLVNSNNSFPETFSYLGSYSCYFTSPGRFVLGAFNVTHSLVLFPLCNVILCYGFHQLHQKSSTSSTMSHCDSFTYHLVVMELIGVLGCVVSFCGNCTGNQEVLNCGMIVFFFTWYGQVYFHILTCVERYVAVVHPITYLSLRTERGIKMRNVTIGCVWLLCFVAMTIVIFDEHIFFDFPLLIFSTLIISFCSLSVLCVLIRPGPRDQGKVRENTDQSKRRAFYTIVAILGVLMLRLSFDLAWAGLEISGDSNNCMIMMCGIWFNLPSSLVLPLLFLQRAGKLQCCTK